MTVTTFYQKFIKHRRKTLSCHMCEVWHDTRCLAQYFKSAVTDTEKLLVKVNKEKLTVY